MILSKIFNLRHFGILERIAGHKTHSQEDIYLNGGFPILDPPTIRGSMAILLHPDFLMENQQYIMWGSPIDVGGLAQGYFGNSIVQYTDRCKLSAEVFLSLLAEAGKLPQSVRMTLAQHGVTNDTLSLLANYLGEEVVNAVSESRNPHGVFFEVCLGHRVTFAERYVLALFCPNTYCSLPIIRDIRNRLNGKLYFYKPRGGIEQIGEELLRFHRYI